MDIKTAIKNRRSYRALESFEVTDELINDLGECAGLAASCFNNQPWRFVFVYDKGALKSVFDTLSATNQWVRAASLVIAVFAKKESDCVIKDREYYLFDAGMACAHIILRATELGLIAHPIAGYDEEKVKRTLGIPDDARLITLIIFGKHSGELGSLLTEKQKASEKERPERLSLEKIISRNKYQA